MSDEDIAQLLENARQLRIVGQFAEALDIVRKVVRLAERADSSTLRVALVEASETATLLVQSCSTEAIDYARAALENSRANVEELGDAWFLLGKRLRMARQNEECVDAWTTAASLFRSSTTRRFELRKVLRRLWEVVVELRRVEEGLAIAEEFFAYARVDDPSDPYREVAHIMLGISLMQSGRAADARPLFQWSVTFCEEVDAQKQRQTSKATDEARAWLDRALAQSAAS